MASTFKGGEKAYWVDSSSLSTSVGLEHKTLTTQSEAAEHFVRHTMMFMLLSFTDQ